VLPEHTRLGVRPNCAVFRLVVAWFESVLRDLRTAPGPIGDVGTSAPPAVPAASNISPRIGWISEEPRRREQTREIDPSGSASTGCDHNSRTVKQLKICRNIANFVFDSRRGTSGRTFRSHPFRTREGHSDGSFYVGHTDTRYLRVQRHREGRGCAYTAERGPVELAWFETTNDASTER
jgi:hypothetical protein